MFYKLLWFYWRMNLVDPFYEFYSVYVSRLGSKFWQILNEHLDIFKSLNVTEYDFYTDYFLFHEAFFNVFSIIYSSISLEIKSQKSILWCAYCNCASNTLHSLSAFIKCWRSQWKWNLHKDNFMAVEYMPDRVLLARWSECWDCNPKDVHWFDPQHCLIHQDNILRQDANLDCASLHPGVKWVPGIGIGNFFALCVAASVVGTMAVCPVLRVKCKSAFET